MCSHSISSPFLLLQERLRSESMCGAELTFKNHSSHIKSPSFRIIFKFGLCFHNTRTYVSLLRLCFKTRMLRTFIAKASSTWKRSITTEKTTIEALTCKPWTTECSAYQRTKTTWEMINDMKASSPFTNHMLPHDQWKRTRFLTPPTSPNMTIFASKGLPSENIYDEYPCGSHVWKYSSVFLAVKKSARVSLFESRPQGSQQQLLRITHEFWPAFMLWKHSTKTDAGSPIWSKCTHLLKI